MQDVGVFFQPKIGGGVYPPNHPMLIAVFHEIFTIHFDPFWGFSPSIFGSTPICMKMA